MFAHQITATSGGRGYRTSPRGGGPLTTVLVPHVGGSRGHDAPAPLWQRIWLNVPDGGESFERPLDHYFPWLLRSDEVNFGHAVAPGPGVAREQVMFPMPRRVVVEWTTVEGGVRCDLTGLVSNVVATSFRRIHNGLEYPSEAWAHPYTPRYRSKAGSNVTLPVRPRPGHDTLGDWVGLTLMRADRSTEPAPIVVEWMRRRSDVVPSVRLHALGFSTDNAKVTDFMDRTVPVIHADDPDVDRVVTGPPATWPPHATRWAARSRRP